MAVQHHVNGKSHAIWHQCYLLPSGSDLPTLTAAEAGIRTQFSDHKRMQGWVDLGGSYIQDTSLNIQWQNSVWNSLPAPCRCVLAAALSRWSAERLSTHQSFCASAQFMVLFQHGTADVIVQWVQIWRVCCPLILINEPRTVRLQPVLHDACHVSWGAVLMCKNSII